MSRCEISRQSLTRRCGVGLAVALLLVAGQGLFADELPGNDAKNRSESSSSGSVGVSEAKAEALTEGWWKRWDADVKDSEDPNELIRAKLNAVITVLESDELDQAKKKFAIDKIACPVFDFQLMSMLALGRTHWGRLKSEEQATFTELFTKRLRDSYQDIVSHYSDQKVKLGQAEPERNGINITMDIVSEESTISVRYKMRKLDNHWRIYDLEIDGVSALLTYRSQFDDILRRGNAQDLFNHLKKDAAP